MSEGFTAEDFAQASFARHEDGRKAIRFGAATDGPPWQIGMFGESTDEDMVLRGWVPVVESRVTLDGLSAAWEAAEEAEECREGDVLVVRDALDAFTVWAAPGRYLIDADTRILSRSPQREPWADLADDLAERSALMDEDAIETAAKALHKAGWRKGGDES